MNKQILKITIKECLREIHEEKIAARKAKAKMNDLKDGLPGGIFCILLSLALMSASYMLISAGKESGTLTLTIIASVLFGLGLYGLGDYAKYKRLKLKEEKNSQPKGL